MHSFNVEIRTIRAQEGYDTNIARNKNTLNDKEESMNKKTFSITSIIVIAMLVLAACSGVSGALANTGTQLAQNSQQATASPSTSSSPTVAPIIVKRRAK